MKISIEADFLEHLLACLANQKFIGEAPTNGDSLAEGKEKYLATQRQMQKVIDVAYNQGWELLQHRKFSSRAGKASAAKLTAKQRKARATKASHSRKSPK